jgi:tellurite methyltransferase
MADYDQEYRNNPRTCGELFADFVAFFESLPTQLSVLDLGCGQARDTLVLARLGHTVHGVDLAPTGIAEFLEHAAAEGLDVMSTVTDIEEFEPGRIYDIVVVDRVLHMLSIDERRRTMIGRLQNWVGTGGIVMVADTRRNRELMCSEFAAGWKVLRKKADFLFVRSEAN